MLVCISTGVNVRYLLVYEEPWNVNVEILDGVSVVEECTVLSPEKVPNRLRATIIDQRSAAQYGQYSAPMYSISGLPPEVSGVPPLTGWILPVNEPEPILSSVLAGTFVTLDTTLARAAPVGPFDELAAGLLFALITMKATTTAITAMMLPDAMRIRRRCSARRSAARWAAIFSRRVASTLVLLALPMLASSNPCVSQLAVWPRAAGSKPAPARRSSPSSRVPGSMLGAPPYWRARARRLGHPPPAGRPGQCPICPEWAGKARK